MRTVLLVSVLMMVGLPAAFAAGNSLNTLDLSTVAKFVDTRVNLAVDQTYAQGAVVLVPSPAAEEEQYMISIQESLDTQCAASGLMSRQNADKTLTYYFIIHVVNVPLNGGHCFIGVHMRDKTQMRQAYIDIFALKE